MCARKVSLGRSLLVNPAQEAMIEMFRGILFPSACYYCSSTERYSMRYESTDRAKFRRLNCSHHAWLLCCCAPSPSHVTNFLIIPTPPPRKATSSLHSATQNSDSNHFVLLLPGYGIQEQHERLARKQGDPEVFHRHHGKLPAATRTTHTRRRGGG